MKRFFFFVASWLIIGSTGCEIGPASGVGLRLPDGDLAKGEAAFHELGCDGCHAIVRDNRSRAGEQPDVIVVLGGRVAHIETHGELVTSIINPSHGFPRRYSKEQVTADDESKMPKFNEIMTVDQLINLTAFLQSKYQLERGSLFID
jgi:sulfur-oxidizing protein SoxX